MTPVEARRILSLYRPGGVDDYDPEMGEALRQLDLDPELKQWFEQHCAFQTAMRRKFREIPAPANLHRDLLAERNIIRPAVWWRQPRWIAAAATFVLVAGLATLLLRPPVPDRFVDFQGRMVRTALKQYSMDIVTNDMKQVRQFMAERGAPADYVVPRGLAQMSLTGGGFLKWRSAPVSMVCFDRGGGQMLYLFVIPRTAVKDAPPESPQFSKLNTLTTACWSRGDRTYLLAGPADADFRQGYF